MRTHRAGTSTFVRPAQPRNASAPMFVTVAGSATSSSPAQSRNADAPTPATGRPPSVAGTARRPEGAGETAHRPPPAGTTSAAPPAARYVHVRPPTVSVAARSAPADSRAASARAAAARERSPPMCPKQPAFPLFFIPPSPYPIPFRLRARENAILPCRNIRTNSQNPRRTSGTTSPRTPCRRSRRPPPRASPRRRLTSRCGGRRRT